MRMSNATWTLLTPQSQGAIAIIQLGGDVTYVLETLTGRTEWQLNRLQLKKIEGIDEVICVKLADDLAQIMPHGSMHVIRLLEERLHELGVEHSECYAFPEASTELESKMLLALSKAASPLAVDLLLQQPAIHASSKESNTDRDAALNFLITPPTVVMLGAPNTGKSTLMNALTSEETSIVHDMPGVTRDAVGARVNCHGLVIDLYDLPGIRKSDDAIEQKAIALSKRLINEADLIIQVRDAENSWVGCDSPRIITVGTKADAAEVPDAQLQVSAHENKNVQELASRMRQALVPDAYLNDNSPWNFDV